MNNLYLYRHPHGANVVLLRTYYVQANPIFNFLLLCLVVSVSNLYRGNLGQKKCGQLFISRNAWLRYNWFFKVHFCFIQLVQSIQWHLYSWESKSALSTILGIGTVIPSPSFLNEAHSFNTFRLLRSVDAPFDLANPQAITNCLRGCFSPAKLLFSLVPWAYQTYIYCTLQ